MFPVFNILKKKMDSRNSSSRCSIGILEVGSHRREVIRATRIGGTAAVSNSFEEVLAKIEAEGIGEENSLEVFYRSLNKVKEGKMFEAWVMVHVEGGSEEPVGIFVDELGERRGSWINKKDWAGLSGGAFGAEMEMQPFFCTKNF